MTLQRRHGAPVRITAFAAALVASGCSTLSPPFDKMKDAQMTVYRLQNYEPPQQPQAAAPGPSGLSALPAQLQQWIAAGASLLPPGLVPPGLLPGAPSQTPPAPADAPRFHNFRILEWQPVSDAGVRSDVVDVLGHAASFQSAASTCFFAEFGFAIAQPLPAAPADVLVSLSCEQVQAFNFTWPYGQTGITPDTAKKFASIAQRVFQGH